MNLEKFVKDKSDIPKKKGVRMFEDLREAIATMERHNSLFYFMPRIDYRIESDTWLLGKIATIACSCTERSLVLQKYNKPLEIRSACKHIAIKLLELPLHPITKCILENRMKHGRVRYTLLSESEPIILGFNNFVKLKWINVYHYNQIRDLAIRFSFNIEERKWSYGKLPPDGKVVEFKIKEMLGNVIS
jgi:hypothetical protein